MILIILIIIAVFLFWICRMLKIPKCGNMVLITGGIKTGKSTLSVRMVYKTWRKQCFKVKVRNLFCKVLGVPFKRFRKEPLPKPLIYSNVPLSIPYVPLTEALLRREERFVYGSVCYIQEASLVADSQTYKDMLLNEQLLLFTKLFAHETHGGYVFFDTQSISDNHYCVKRTLSTYFDIHHSIKIPFFVLMFVRELKYSEDGQTVNTYDSDVEDTLKMVIVPKRTWKMFDRYCYSVLTDHLPVNKNVNEYSESLKADKIISFKKYRTLEVYKNGDDE